LSADWKALAREAKLTLDERERLVVTIGEVRKHRIEIRAEDECLRLQGIVVRRANAEWSGITDADLWRINRLRELVGFRFDAKGNIVGESLLPLAKITSEEFGFVVKTLAQACDRMEYLLTGRDVE